MKNLPTKKMDVLNGEYVNDFEWLALSLQDRLYRTALILTKSPREAEQLVQETHMQSKHFISLNQVQSLGPGYQRA